MDTKYESQNKDDGLVEKFGAQYPFFLLFELLLIVSLAVSPFECGLSNCHDRGGADPIPDDLISIFESHSPLITVDRRRINPFDLLHLLKFQAGIIGVLFKLTIRIFRLTLNLVQ